MPRELDKKVVRVPADRSIQLFFPQAPRNARISIVPSTRKPYDWPRAQGLSDALRAMGLEHVVKSDFVCVKQDGKELFVSTRSDAYEKCVIWLVRTGRVLINAHMGDALAGYREFGYAAEVDEALALGIKAIASPGELLRGLPKTTSAKERAAALDAHFASLEQQGPDND